MYLILLIIGMLISGVMIIHRYHRIGPAGIVLDPIILFSLYFGLIHFFTPAWKYHEGIFRYSSTYSQEAFLINAISSLSCYVIAVLVFDKIHQPTYEYIKYIKEDKFKYNLIIGYFLCIIGLATAYLDVKTIVTSLGSIDNYMSDKIMGNEERNSLRTLVYFSIIGVSIVNLSRRLYNLSKFHLYISIFIIVILSYYFSLISSRNGILLFIIIFSSIQFIPIEWLVERNRKYMMIFVISLISLASAYFLTSQRYSVSSNSAYIAVRQENVAFYMMDGAFGNDEAMLWMWDNGYPYLAGKTYLAAITNIVPRSIWPDKPLGGGPELINLIRPGSYVVGQSGNNSLTTGLLAESQMNFGIIGVIFAIIFWAISCKYLLKFLHSSRSMISVIMISTILVLFSSLLFYAEFLGFVVRILIFGFAWIAILIFQKFIRHGDKA